MKGELTNPLSLNLYTYVLNNPLRYIDPSGHKHVEIGVSYTQEDRDSITYLQAIFDLAKSLGYSEQMQLAHDQANLIRLKYESRVDRTIYADSLFKTGIVLEALTISQYNEVLYGNAIPVPFFDDPLFIGMGFITGVGGTLKIGYTIADEAINSIMKVWGKTTGKKAVEAFSKSASKGFVPAQGANGLKDISSAGMKRNGNHYTVEIKVQNKEFANYRIYGYKNEQGQYVFDWFDKALH